MQHPTYVYGLLFQGCSMHALLGWNILLNVSWEMQNVPKIACMAHFQCTWSLPLLPHMLKLLHACAWHVKNWLRHRCGHDHDFSYSAARVVADGSPDCCHCSVLRVSDHAKYSALHGFVCLERIPPEYIIYDSSTPPHGVAWDGIRKTRDQTRVRQQ